MREEHPIDERFGALYDTEATPPEAVHDALAARLGWSTKAPTPSFWQPWKIAASSALLIGALLACWISAEQEPTELSATEVGAGAVPADKNHGPSQVIPPSFSSGTTDSEHISEGSSTGAAFTNSGGMATTATTRPRVGSARSGSSVFGNAGEANKPPDVNNTKQKTGTTNDSTPHARVGFGNNANNTSNSTTAPLTSHYTIEGLLDDEVNSRLDPPPSLRFGNSNEQAVVPSNEYSAKTNASTSSSSFALAMDPLPVFFDPVPSPSSPLISQRPPDYVQPHGTWWVAPYFGIGSVNGEWRGDDADALREAEKWNTSAQAGILAGRAWRSGWSVSGGVGLARLRSTFAYSGPDGTVDVTEVDTTWTATAYDNTPLIIYTWNIDSLVETRPGASVRRDANNSYSAVQVPVVLAWHTTVRRFRFGAFGGLTAWIPSQRKGITLVRPSADASPAVAELTDPSTNERFQPQLHGRFGVSIGRTLTEHLDLCLEPFVSTPLLVNSKDATPWLTQPTLQLRLQYEFPSRH